MRSTVLHCGCFLAVTLGPDTWECLRLQTREQSLNPSLDGQLLSFVQMSQSTAALPLLASEKNLLYVLSEVNS